MRFSPGFISSLIVSPLRYYFARYAGDLVWTQDENTSTIEIDTINNFNKIGIQNKPRILISRGGYSISSSGLSDSMAEGTPPSFRGVKTEKRFMMATGMGQVLIEARNEGTCERIVEQAENFLLMSGPVICNVHGFKNFGVPLSVSPCTPSREDTEIFQCTISLPWSKELSFETREDGIEFKKFILSPLEIV